MKIFKSKHVGCYGVVCDNDEVLLIRKARGPYKGLLDLPGGGIEYGESSEDALKREFLEETGMIVKDYKLKTIITNYVVWDFDETHKEDLQHIAIIYDVIIDPSDFENIKKNPDGLDSLGASWYKIDELDINELSPLARIIKK